MSPAEIFELRADIRLNGAPLHVSAPLLSCGYVAFSFAGGGWTSGRASFDMAAVRKLKRCGLEPAVVDALSIRGVVTCSDLLLHDRLFLQDYLDMSMEEVKKVICTVCSAVAPEPKTVLAMEQSGSGSMRVLPTELPALD
eukprot:RCo006187